MFIVRIIIFFFLQNYALFNGTLRFNLDPEGRYSDQHLFDCIKRCGNMADFIEQSGEGLEHVIDSDGTGLSEGEKQMICCMRGLLSEY